MRLSPFHLELAKRVAQGQPNREIKKSIKISDSRLSVLKANPLFAQQVSRFAQMEADKYHRALEVMGDKAVDIAKEMTNLATSPLVPPNVRLSAATEVLDRLAQAEGVSKTNGETDEIVFEQMLRVTKRSNGTSLSQSDLDAEPPNSQEAYSQLQEDFSTIEPEWEEVATA